MRKIIFDSLNFANANGYFDKGEHLDGASPEDIAADLIQYAIDCEHYTVEQILPHVKEWLELRTMIGRVF